MKISGALVVLISLALETLCQTKNYYKILGLSDTASIPEVKKAFRNMAKKLHPDKCKEEGAEARFREILEAYEVLSDEEKKRQYDASKKAGGSGGRPFNFGGGTRAQNFNFDFSELFKQFEDDIFNAGSNRESMKQHYRGHFGSHFKAHAKNTGGSIDIDDFFTGFDSHFSDDHEEIFGNMNSMFNFDGLDSVLHQQAHRSHRKSEKCHTVTQKIGNTVTTYTQCS